MYLKKILRYFLLKKRGLKFEFKYVGNISRKSFYGKNVILYGNVFINDGVKINDYSYCNIGTRIISGEIGRFCSIGYDCLIGANEHPVEYLITHPISHDKNYLNKHFFVSNKDIKFQQKKPPIINDNVWIGAKSIILRGVVIGEGAIIAANSVVTKDVEPYTVVGGSPARIIKNRKLEYNLDDISISKLTTDEIIQLMEIENK